MSSSIFVPLKLMFTSTGYMITDPNDINYNWYASMGTFKQNQQFKQHYNVFPLQFAKNELSLRDRCRQHNIEYTPPRPDDSVAATKARRKVMNRAIKTALQRDRRAADPDGRFLSNLQDVIRRRKRRLNEDAEQRQQRLDHGAESKRLQREHNLKVECDQKGVKYTPPPQNNNESIEVKKKRRKLIRKQFKTTPTKEPQSTTLFTYSCPHQDSTSPCDCIQPPAKTTFAVIPPPNDTDQVIMRKSITKFASSSTSLAVYCNNKNMGPLKETCYRNRYKQPYIQHKFSLQLDNTTHECLPEEVRFTEIWINEAFAFNFLDCAYTHATINGDSAVIKHYMNPKHLKSCWGWEENIMLEVVCTGLPSDIIEDAKNVVVKWEDVKGWDGEHLYDLMSETTTIKVEFRCITFEEFAIRKGYPTHSVAIDGIDNNYMTNKYGPNWRNTWEQIESEKKKKEEEEKKRKYWMCVNGIYICHGENGRPGMGGPCRDCQVRRFRMFGENPSLYTKCINGYEICHDGIRQCPSCKDANKPINPTRYQCMWCNKYFHSINQHWSCKPCWDDFQGPGVPY